MAGVREVSTQLPSTSMEERGSLVCLEEAVVQLICWGLSRTREESLGLMEVMVEDPSPSTAVLFEEYLEDLALRLTALVSIAVIHSYWLVNSSWLGTYWMRKSACMDL